MQHEVAVAGAVGKAIKGNATLELRLDSPLPRLLDPYTVADEDDVVRDSMTHLDSACRRLHARIEVLTASCQLTYLWRAH